jgi:hypothetical protein
MKKRMIIGVAMAALLVCATAYAQWSNSSDSKSATAQILVEGGVLNGIVVTTDGTNAQTFNIYDTENATTSGTKKLIPAWVVTTSATDRTQTMGFYPPVRFERGLYVTVSGSGTVGYVVYYSR